MDSKQTRLDYSIRCLSLNCDTIYTWVRNSARHKVNSPTWNQLDGLIFRSVQESVTFATSLAIATHLRAICH
jgi:hypothetical protein